MARTELKRLFYEWRLKFERIRNILLPPVWREDDWKSFACSLAVLVQRHGATWRQDERTFWDLRWTVREGGELVCQVEQRDEGTVSVVVGHRGGFARDGTYIWMWAELSPEGEFLRKPYFIDGTWKEALVTLLLPLTAQGAFFLEAPAATPERPRLAGAPDRDSVPPARAASDGVRRHRPESVAG